MENEETKLEEEEECCGDCSCCGHLEEELTENALNAEEIKPECEEGCECDECKK